MKIANRKLGEADGSAAQARRLCYVEQASRLLGQVERPTPRWRRFSNLRRLFFSFASAEQRQVEAEPQGQCATRQSLGARAARFRWPRAGYFGLRFLIEYNRVSPRIKRRSPAMAGVAMHISSSPSVFVCRILNSS